MRCICGYEQKEDFDSPCGEFEIDKETSARYSYPGLYFCPMCGTVKVKLEVIDENTGYVTD